VSVFKFVFCFFIENQSNLDPIHNPTQIKLRIERKKTALKLTWMDITSFPSTFRFGIFSGSESFQFGFG
jgi:hypothetical protein